LTQSGNSVLTFGLPIYPLSKGPTGRFMLQRMAAVAELEAGLISHAHAQNRTKRFVRHEALPA
jgi:hypothetical protein